MLFTQGISRQAFAEDGDAGQQADADSESTEGEPAESKPRFDIWEFQVEGNKLLTRRDIEQSVYRFMGRDKTIDDVDAARASLEQRYRDAGFQTVLVDIPEQEVLKGIVRLRVTEGKIDRLWITGSRYFSLERIRQQVPSLQEGAVPHFPTVQTELAALNNRSRDRSITPLLRSGRTPGTLEVELEIKDQNPLHGSIELNDRYTPDTTRTRLNASIGYDNLWQKEHSFSLQYQTSPQDFDEVQVWAGTYVSRLSGSNNVLVLYAVDSDSNTSTVGDLSIIGKGRIYGLRGILPFAGESAFHRLTLGADYKDFREDVQLGGASAPATTPISYVAFSTAYDGTWLHSERSRTSLNLGINFGIRGIADEDIECEYLLPDNSIGVDEFNEFECKRFGARPNYLYLTGHAEHLLTFTNDAQLRGYVEWQIADSPLVSGEQFSSGGASSVRGYYESQELGDDGVRTTLEWHTPSYARWRPETLQNLRGLVFVDAAWLHTQEALPGQDENRELYGAGIGLRLQAYEDFSATLDWAMALQDSGRVDSEDTRIHASVNYSF